MFGKWVLAAVVAVGLVGFAAAPATADHGSGGGGGGGGNVIKVEGSLVGVNTTTAQVVIRRFNGAVLTLTLTRGVTKIERNGIHVGLRAFRAGDRVEAVIVNGVVVKFEGVDP